jgi:hypothetical protein
MKQAVALNSIDFWDVTHAASVGSCGYVPSLPIPVTLMMEALSSS